MAAGRQPSGGSDVTPILLAPKLYRFCRCEMHLLVLLDLFSFHCLMEVSE